MDQVVRVGVPRRKVDAGPLKSVGAFIYSVSTRRYLFLLRNTTKYAGTWGLAGGKVEVDENLMVSLLREISEEVGVTMANAKVIPIEQFTSDNNKFTYHTFLIPVEEEFIPILNGEHRGYCWVKIEDHPMPLHPGLKRTVNFKDIINKIKTIETILWCR
jgi:8-oxo-dGTP pyrophosphatase MutT (NUDIX family)